MSEDCTEWCVTYTPPCRREPENVRAFQLRREGPWLVFDTSVLVIGTARTVVALPVREDEVTSVRRMARP